MKNGSAKETPRFIRWFQDVGMDDVGLVGGKNASLGEMYRALMPRGIRIPNGFAVTAEAYFRFLAANGLEEKVRDGLAGLDTQNNEQLRERGKRLRDDFLKAEIPADLRGEILAAFHRLGDPGTPAAVAVRSSATAEDLPGASFAGQQETFLNVEGDEALLEACRGCFASLFTDRAISYRADQGFDHLKIGLSIGIQRMVRSDRASSGVMFTIDTETGFRDVVLINSAYGLGENIVQGAVNPDEFYVFKPTLKKGFRPLLQKRLGNKEFKLVYGAAGGGAVENVPVPAADRRRFSISDEDILTLSNWACEIEDHYSGRAGHPMPMDIEWAKDGDTGQLFIVQARPETVQSRKEPSGVLESFHLRTRSAVLLRGGSVGAKIAAGPVRVIDKAEDLGELRQGEILVTARTDPDWEPAMKRAAAVITDRGGRTCHAAIVSRELGLPAVVGTETGTSVLRTGQTVTVSCAEGETGFVYEGRLDFEVERVDLSASSRPRTKIMLNVANPDESFRLSFLPNDGVGLARMEFIIGNSIGVHPLALLNFERLTDPAVKARIEELTPNDGDKAGFFVEKLAQGVGMIAAAFYPKDVIVRLSDFKTNEYADLIGGKAFEPHEENPMLGFRGASRYYDPRYREGFALECRAMKQVREVMGLENVKLMIPFCRTPEEGRKVIEEMAKNGLRRGEKGLEIYVMCEIPSNVILAEEFAGIFDGFSIGSNDLTQLVLGVDRDSEIVSHVFDERDEAVKRMIAQVIRTARARGRKIGLCGQAPSDYPEFARFLVENGIDGISLSADAIVKTTADILQFEKEMSMKGHAVSGGEGPGVRV